MDEQVTVKEEEKDTVKTTKCLNCGTEFEGNFCPHCGQKADTGRFTVRFIFQNFILGILSNDGGVWFTIKNLFTRPGQMMVDIINGKRKSYFSPFPMLFLTLSLYVVIFSFTGSRDGDFDGWDDEDGVEVEIKRDSLDNADSTSFGAEHVRKQLLKQKAKNMVVYSIKFLQKHYTACFVFTIPVYILAARWGFGRKNRRKYNWGEYCIPMVYSLILLVLYRCLMSIVFYFSPPVADKMDSYLFLVNIVVFTACFKKMMGYNLLVTAWRSFMTFVLYWILIISIIVLLAVCAVFIVFATV